MNLKSFFCCLYLIISSISFLDLSADLSILPSWNEGPTKNAIIEFVRTTTDPSHQNYIAPSNRIVTFDQDGTLWVEHPLYAQAAFALDRIKTLAATHPEWKNEEPFKAVISEDLLAISKFTEQDWERIIAVTHAGMSTEAFSEIAKQWIATAKHPRFKRPYTELVYQPMLELIDYFRANAFKTYIVTGGGQEFVRTYSQLIYGMAPEQIVGSSVVTKYEYQDGKPLLMRLPKVFFIDDHSGKAIGINLFIGKKPSAAFGNSDGDREMLEWTQAGEGTKLMMLVFHDDPIREYAYGPANGKPKTDVGTFSELLMEEAKKKGWFVISMKNDWKNIFPFEKH